MDRKATISLDGLLKSLGALSVDNRRWLAEHLMDQVKEEERHTSVKDNEFMRDFFSTPYDNPLTAEEEKQMIRNGRYFDPDRKINQLNYGD